MLTTTYAPAERAKVQASHDFMVYASTASAAALSGVLQAKAGWTVINLAALPLMAAVVGAAHLADGAAAARGGGPDAGGVERLGIATGIAMGDRYDRNQRKVAHPALRGLKPPSEILTWGLSSPARIGHNQGPPLDEPVADAFVRWRWRKAYREAWKTPSMANREAARRARRGRGRQLPRVHARAARHPADTCRPTTSPSAAKSPRPDCIEPMRAKRGDSATRTFRQRLGFV